MSCRFLGFKFPHLYFPPRIQLLDENCLNKYSSSSLELGEAHSSVLFGSLTLTCVAVRVNMIQVFNLRSFRSLSLLVTFLSFFFQGYA